MDNNIPINLGLKKESWKNIFDSIRDSEIMPKGNFWTAIQRLEESLEHSDEHNQLLYDALGLWGKDAQLNQAIQEMAELIKEITKVYQLKIDGIESDYDKVAEETADVIICIEELMVTLNNHADVARHLELKMSRLKARIEIGKINAKELKQ